MHAQHTLGTAISRAGALDHKLTTRHTLHAQSHTRIHACTHTHAPAPPPLAVALPVIRVRALVFSPYSSRHSCMRVSGASGDFHIANVRLNCRAGGFAAASCPRHRAQPTRHRVT